MASSPLHGRDGLCSSVPFPSLLPPAHDLGESLESKLIMPMTKGVIDAVASSSFFLGRDNFRLGLPHLCHACNQDCDDHHAPSYACD